MKVLLVNTYHFRGSIQVTRLSLLPARYDSAEVAGRTMSPDGQSDLIRPDNS